MKRHRYLWILVGLLAFASLACNAFAGEPLEPTLPRPDLGESGDADTSDVAGGPAGLPTAVIQNIAPTATLAGEFPPTATPIVAEPVDGDAVLRALVDVNIRMGPGVAYGRDSFLFGGETAVVLGHHAESGWWKIVCPERSDGNVCWVSGGSQYTSVSNAGAAQAVAAPPTPTAEPTVEVTAVSDLSASSSVADSTEMVDLEFSMASAGARIVYADEGALWLLSVDDSAAEPIWLADAEKVTDLLISPNGRYVAYILENDSDYTATLNLIELDTGIQRVLIDVEDFIKIASSDLVPSEYEDVTARISQMQWLADSKSLAFNTQPWRYIGGIPVGWGRQDLWTVDLMGTLTERFAAGEGGGTFAISSENIVLFGQTTAVVRANLDGTNKETLIEFPQVSTGSDYQYFPRIQWHHSQDAHTAIASSNQDTVPMASLWQIPATGEAEQVASIQSTILLHHPVYWSADGGQLAYVAPPSELVVANGDGSQSIEYVVEGVEQFLSWNPSGIHFVYAGQGNYAVGQVSGEPLVVDVAEGKTAVSAQWLNDNTVIIALGSADNWDFRLQTIEGPATRLVSGSTTPLFNTWSP